jgi:outer membrane protein OmpA-like peptidoglycan-associated protein
MKNIKKYNEFVDDLQTNEGIKDWVAGAGLLASTLLPNKATAGTEPGDTLHKVTKSKSEMEIMTKYQHWTLDSTHVDTLYEVIKKKNGGGKVWVDTLDFDVDGDLFLTGNYTLGPDVIDSIYEAINDITAKDGIITDFQIESSTDAEPIDMEYGGKTGNDALAQRRADGVKDQLIKIGVDPSVISIETLPEQGPHLYSDDMTKEQRVKARIQTKSFRYVKIRIVYIILSSSIPLPDELDTLIKTKKTYYLSKPFSGGGKRPPRLKSHFKKTTISVPDLEVKRDNGRTKCAKWGKKRLRDRLRDKNQFWNNKKLGYE